jgi:hypothetical protein
MLVLVHFLADYHSGQWSRGYRILSQLIERFSRQGIRPLDIPLNAQQRQQYDLLVQRLAAATAR